MQLSWHDHLYWAVHLSPSCCEFWLLMAHTCLSSENFLWPKGTQKCLGGEPTSNVWMTQGHTVPASWLKVRQHVIYFILQSSPGDQPNAGLTWTHTFVSLFSFFPSSNLLPSHPYKFLPESTPSVNSLHKNLHFRLTFKKSDIRHNTEYTDFCNKLFFSPIKLWES